jgi:hypothetical protein
LPIHPPLGDIKGLSATPSVPGTLSLGAVPDGDSPAPVPVRVVAPGSSTAFASNQDSSLAPVGVAVRDASGSGAAAPFVAPVPDRPTTYSRYP